MGVIETNALPLRVNPRHSQKRPADTPWRLRLADNWVSLSSELERLGTPYPFENPMHMNRLRSRNRTST